MNNAVQYFAGLIDADGWIQESESSARIVVANTVIKPLQMLHEWMGGCLYLPKKRKPQHKDCWFWEKNISKKNERWLSLCNFFIEKRNLSPQFISDEYAAGMFDGDGTVTIRKQIKGGGQYLCVELYSDYLPILRAFKNTYNGTIYPNYRGGKCERWCSTCCVAENFLKRVITFLIIKRERAELAVKLRLLNTVPKEISVRGLKNGYRMKRPEVFQQMNQIKSSLLLMNRLGC